MAVRRHLTFQSFDFPGNPDLASKIPSLRRLPLLLRHSALRSLNFPMWSPNVEQFKILIKDGTLPGKVTKDAVLLAAFSPDGTQVAVGTRETP